MRPLTGSDFSCSVWIVVDADVFVTSTAGTDELTVTDSETLDSCILKSTVGTLPMSSLTSGRVAGLEAGERRRQRVQAGRQVDQLEETVGPS